jgi:hypothetical protein
MKIITLLGLTLIFFYSCKTEEKSGYNCNSGNCTAVFDNPQYLTLTDCQSACGSVTNIGYNCVSGNCVSVTNNAQYTSLSSCQSACSGNVSTTGSVTISAFWSNTPPWDACGSPYTVVIGLGYNSTDVSNESYFIQSSFYSSTANYSKDGLAPGIYYYGAKKTFNASICGTGQGIPPTVKKSGSFTIIAGQTTTITGVNLN